MGDGDNHLLALYQILDVMFELGFFQAGAARVSELVTHLDQFIAHHFHAPRPRLKDFQEVLDLAGQFLGFGFQLLAFHAGQALQAQLQDGAGLGLGKPVFAINHLMARIVDQGDEIGDIGKALLSFQDELKIARSADEERAEQQREQAIVVENLSTGLLRLSQGDFSTKIETPFAGEHEKLREDFNKTVTTLNETLGHVVSAVNRIRNGAAEINQSSNDLSHRTESQAATLEETAAALEEMTVSVKSAADSARSVEQITGEAKQEAEVSGGVVQNAVTAMTEIEQSSKKIEQIISVIDDIAFQTNLLALNAAVEAARAGEYGKGFAVAASEVKNLATLTSKATGEISSQISEIQTIARSMATTVNNTGSVVQRIHEISSNIAAAVEEQSVSTGQINQNIRSLTDEVGTINTEIRDVQTAASQSNQSSRVISDDAGVLQQGFRDMDQVIHRFLADVRS